MGRRGPKPQSTVLKLVKGNPGKRKLDKKQPKLPPPKEKDIAPPPHLRPANSGAAKEWKRLYPILVKFGIVHSGNLKMFERYCMVTGELQKVENVCKRMNVETAQSCGFFRTAASLTQQQRQLARDIGLSVFAGENVAGQKKEESKLEKFIKPAG